MDNGFSTSDAVLTSAMSGGFGGNRGGGSWGGSGIVDGFAGLGSNAIRTEKAENATRDGDKCLSAEINAGLTRTSDQAEETRRSAQITAVKDAITASEFRSGDRARDTDRTLQDMRLEQCKCCEEAKLENFKISCETQKLILATAATTDALILAVEGRATLDKLAEVRAELVLCKCCPS